MVIAHKPTSPPVEALFGASKATEIEALIASLPGAVWRKLGGEDVGNYAQVNSAAGPVEALLEKVTNAFDALIEQEAYLTGNTDFDSPRKAVGAFFGVPKGQIEYLADPDRRRELAERITVTMRAGDTEDEPTFVTRDSGIGQHPDDFPRTLVSLNLENKRDKFHLLGAYGWGGSAALSFSKYTLFVSRRDPRLLAGRADQVGWTVVRFNDLASERTAKYGEYEYLCLQTLGEDGKPIVPRFDAALLPYGQRDWSGTICTLLDFEIGRTIARAPAWLGSKSLRNVCNALLFDPPLPFLVRDERPKYAEKNSKNADGVIVVGNAARLAELAAKKKATDLVAAEADEEEAREVGVVHDDLVRRQLPTGGCVTVRYWVMGQSKKYKKGWEPARNYVAPEQAVTLTHNGQRHAAWGRELFEGIGFSSLGKAIIAQVGADDLAWTEKRRLFSTTRDQLRKTDVALALRALVVKVLEEDDYLKGEEKKRRERALGHESKEQAEKIQRMLEKAIEGYKAGKVELFRTVWSADPDLSVYVDQPLAKQEPPIKDSESPEAEPTEYTDGPTFIRVLNAPVHVPAGGRAIVRLQIDAADGYFTGLGGGEFLAMLTKGAEVFVIEGYSSLRSGMMRCTVSAPGATPGERGRVIFTVTRGDALPLVDDAELIADAPPQKRVKPTGKKDEGKIQGPPVKACYRSQWDDVGGFDETVVARLVPEPGNPDLFAIWVNWDYGQLNDKLRRERRLDEEIVDNFKMRFVASMGFLVWLQRMAGAEIDQNELRRAAEVHLFSTSIEV